MRKLFVLFLAALLLMSSLAMADDVPAPTIISTACTANSDCASDQVCSPCPEEAACTSEKICMGSETIVQVVPDTIFPEGATRVMLCGSYEHTDSGTFTGGINVYAPPFPNTYALTLRNRDVYDIEARRINSGLLRLQISKRTGATESFGPYELSLAERDVATVGPAGQEIKIRFNDARLSQYVSHRSPGWWWLMRGYCAEFDVGAKSEALVARTATATQARPTATLATTLQANLPSAEVSLPPRARLQARQPELKPIEIVSDRDVASSKFRFSEYTCRDGTLNFDAGTGCASLGNWYAKAKRFCKEHRDLQDFKVFNASACVPGRLTAGVSGSAPAGENQPNANEAGVNAVPIAGAQNLQKRSLFNRILGRWWSVA